MISVRAAVRADSESAVEIVRRSIVELLVADHRNDAGTLEEWLANKTVGQFHAWLESRRHYCVVAEEAERVCAVGLIEDDGEIQLCHVLPGMQRRRLGSAVLQELEAQAKRWGLARVRLKSSGPAQAFYERHGYRRTGGPGKGFGITRPLPYAKDFA